MSNDRYNASHCVDNTAYRAIKNMDEERRVKKLMSNLLYIVNLAGYEVVGRITIQNKKTGKIWR